MLKSDQEPANLALTNAFQDAMAAQNVDCQIENSPKGDARSISNGEAELTVGIAQGLSRTLKYHAEQNISKQIDPKSPVLGWLMNMLMLWALCFPTVRRHVMD